jgi:Na+-driven multidrug efflux pump
MFLLTGTAFGIAMAATILVGQRIGAGDIEGAKGVIGTGATFFAVISTIMAIAGLMFSESLLMAMNVPADSLPLSVSYLRVMFLALPSMYMYAFATSILRAAGDSKTPLYFTLLSVAIGIVLNPVFILGLGPFQPAGVAGSALATFVAQVLSLTACAVRLYRQRYPRCASIRKS